MIDEQEATELARRILEAERSKRPPSSCRNCTPTSRSTTPTPSKRAGVRLAEAVGRVVRARKIGLTSKVMQDAVGIDKPDNGVIYDDMFYGHGDTVPFDRFIAPRLEVELAFVLGKRLSGPDCTLEEVLAASTYVTPAIEILDARIQMIDPDTGRAARSSTPSPTTPPTGGIVVGRQHFDPTSSTCRGCAPCCAATARSRSRAWPRRCSITRRAASPGSPTGSPGRASRCGPARLILAGSFTRPVWVRAR